MRLLMVCIENVWYLVVIGVKIGMEYGFCIYGEFVNLNKLMFDFYVKVVNGKFDLSSEESCFWFLFLDNCDNVYFVLRVVIIFEEFDWEDDIFFNMFWVKIIVYELYVKGFS